MTASYTDPAVGFGIGQGPERGIKTRSRDQDQTAGVGSVKMVYRGGRGSHLDDECASPFSDDNGLRSGDLDPRGRSDEMVYFVGLDVSVKATSGVRSR